MFPVFLLVNRQQSRLAEHAIGKSHVIDLVYDVLANNDPQYIVVVDIVHSILKFPYYLIEFIGSRIGSHAIGSGTLGSVIKMRQINIEEMRLPSPGGKYRRSSDPLG